MEHLNLNLLLSVHSSLYFLAALYNVAKCEVLTLNSAHLKFADLLA